MASVERRIGVSMRIACYQSSIHRSLPRFLGHRANAMGTWKSSESFGSQECWEQIAI